MNVIAYCRSYWLLILIIILLPVAPVLGQELTGVQTVGNDFYEVFVDASTGLYTTRTGPQHPAGAGISVLYNGDSQSPGTSFNTIRSYKSADGVDYTTDYVQRDVTGAVLLSGFAPTTERLEGNGLRTRYLVDHPIEGTNLVDKLEVIQDIRVIGNTFQTSAVQVTTRVTNLSVTATRIGIRYLWDFEIGQDDGPAFAQRRPDSDNMNAEVEYSAPAFNYFRIQDNDRNANPPTLSVLGTVNTPAGFNPPATSPTLLRNACWVDAARTAFDYTIDAQRIINTTDASTCTGSTGGDGAVLYYFGHNRETAKWLQAEQDTVEVSAYIFLELPAQTDTVDSDGDGLLDTWETVGIDFNNDGVIDVQPPAGLNPRHKDILIYYDWTSKPNGGSNEPQQESINRVINAFKNAPVTNLDGVSGITIHFRKGTLVSDGDDGQLGTMTGDIYSWQEFADIKAESFPSELWPYYHYSIFANYHVSPNGSSGRSRNGSNFGAGSSDFIVTIGSWNRSGEDLLRVESGTIMHELGHNLGLGHGGTDALGTPNHTHRKPNYLSVMNYSFQTLGIPTSSGVVLDYSRFDGTDLRTLNEGALDESLAVALFNADGNLVDSTLTGYNTRQYCRIQVASQPAQTPVPEGTSTPTPVPPTATPAPAIADFYKTVDDIRYFVRAVDITKPIDWNCDGQSETSVSANINATRGTDLTTSNDWERIIFNGGAIGSLGTVLDLPLTTDTSLYPEPTLHQHQDLQDGFFTDDSASMTHILNGSFEEGSNEPHVVVPAGNGISGWEVFGVGVDWFGAGNGLTAAHGARSIDLASSAAGGIRQSFATSPGTRYTVRFAMSGETSQNPAQKDMTVSAGDTTETFTVSGPANEWEYQSMTFTATDETTTLTFTSLVDGIYGPQLDDVRVQAGEQVVVPETTSATGTGCIVDIFLANELSDAINAANAGTACSTIRLNEDIPLGRLIPPYTNDMGDNAFPIITSDIVIEGNGHTISRVNAESDFRFFFVDARDGKQASLTINNLTLSGGNLLDGGAIVVDARNGGTAALTLNNVTFTNNTAGGNGGAIATLSMNGGTVTTTITDSHFSGNVGIYGAAFYNGGFDGGNATAIITNTVFDGNRTDNEGGAIYNNGLGSNGHANLNLSGSTFTNNSALRGGAIFNNGSRGGRAVVRFESTSFTLNTATTGDAIYSNGVDGVTDIMGSFGDEVVGAGGNTTQCFSDDSGVLVVLDICEAQ